MQAVILKSTSQSEPISSFTYFHESQTCRVSKSKDTTWLLQWNRLQPTLPTREPCSPQASGWFSALPLDSAGQTADGLDSQQHHPPQARQAQLFSDISSPPSLSFYSHLRGVSENSTDKCVLFNWLQLTGSLETALNPLLKYQVSKIFLIVPRISF